MNSSAPFSICTLLLLTAPLRAAPQRAHRAPPRACFDAVYPAWRLPAPSAADATAGHFDADGDIDIAVARQGGTDIWLRRGPRDYVLHQSIGSSGRMEAGDMDGDGDLDLVLVDGMVRVWKNNGSGTFQSASSQFTIATAVRPLLGDLDGDGDLDVTVEGSAGQSAVLLNTGTGSLAASVSYAQGGRVALADFDGDGDRDMAAATEGASTVNLLENAGNGSFSLRTSATPSPVEHLFAGDMNGDGTNDVAELTTTGAVRVIRNLGSWSFANSPAVPAAFGSVIDGADVDADGDIDLAVEDVTDLVLLENHGDGTFDPARRFPNGAESVDFEFTHLNGDGWIDVLSACRHGHVVTLFEGDPGGSFESASRHGLPPYTFRIAAGKLDADARDDLVLLTEDDTAIVAMNDGGDAFTHTSISFTQVAFLDLGDLDGDGYDDLAVSGNAGLSWLANDGTGQFGAPQELLVGTMQGVAIEDMDLDGDEDIVVCWTDGDQVVFLENDGAGAFEFSGSTTVDGPVRLALGDLNGDGFPDVATTHGNTTFSWFLNNGHGLLGLPHTTTLSVIVIRSIDVGDVNGDGREDIVALDEGNFDQGEVEVLLNNGSGAFVLTSQHAVGPFGRQVLVVDLDGDRDEDVVVACWDSDGVSILRNDGFGQLEHEQYPAGPSPFGVVASDLNLDGHLDLAVANEETLGSAPGGYTILYAMCR